MRPIWGVALRGEGRGGEGREGGTEVWKSSRIFDFTIIPSKRQCFSIVHVQANPFEVLGRQGLFKPNWRRPLRIFEMNGSRC